MASRRDVLRIGGAIAALGPLGCRQARGCDMTAAAVSDRPLKEQAADRGLLFGTAADRDPLVRDQPYADAVVAECAMVTPENSMKWERLRPSPTTFDFDNADWLVDFAAAHDLDVHGHTLAWHLQMPAWFDQVVDRRNAERHLADHIETVAGRYAGRLRSWDVVNEAVDPDFGRKDGLRPSPWLRHLGAGYIETAFRLAAEADPKARLVYNDFGVEYEDAYFEQRRHHILDLLSGLLMSGAPIHALGVQSHLAGDRSSDFKLFARFLEEVAALGLDIMITELDVSDQGLPADPKARDCQVADIYSRYLDVVLASPGVRSIAVWGLSDAHSWLREFRPRADGLPVRPLPLDAAMSRKPAWRAIAEALSG